MTNSPYSGSEEDDYTDSDVSETERSSVVDDPPAKTQPRVPQLSLGTKNAQKAAETRSLGAQSAQTSSSGTTVAVDLVSSAFQVSITPGKADESSHEVMDSIRTRCVNGMGIVEDDLEFFEIKPLSDSEAASAVARGSHVGVRVKRSGFTLGGLEQLLEEHARLATNLDKCTASSYPPLVLQR
eukprot:gene3277-4128_t